MSGDGSMPYGYYGSTTAKYVDRNGYNASGSWGLWNKVDPLGDGNLDVSGGVYLSGGTGIAGAGMFVVDVDWDGFYRGVFNTSYFGVFGLRPLRSGWFENYNANVGNRNVGAEYGGYNWVGALNANAPTGTADQFEVDGNTPKTGISGYLNVVNARDWESYMGSTVGGAAAEVTDRGLNVVAGGNSFVMWFGGNYQGDWLNRDVSPAIIRGVTISGGGFYISSTPTTGYYYNARPLCKTAILSRLGVINRNKKT